MLSFLEIGLGNRFSITHGLPDYLETFRDRANCTRVMIPWIRPQYRFFHFFRLLHQIRKADVVITNDYFNAALTNLFLILSASRARHAVIGLNISSNRVITSKNPVIRSILNRIFFGRIDMAIVASRPEAKVFHEMCGIPLGRFSFVRWSYDLPIIPGSFSNAPRPYFCMIGRNNRDHTTFCEAIKELEVEGVIISSTPPANQLPNNVQSFTNLSLGDCIECIRGSVACVTLVNDANRGAGHITIVTTMHCGRPQIISNVETVLDYFEEGTHALTVPIKDIHAVRSAMEQLLKDPKRANSMGAAAQLYASKNLTHERRRKILEARFVDWIENDQILWDENENDSEENKGK